MNDSSLEGILKELAGYADMKPFECIGTIEEVKLALSVSIAIGPIHYRHCSKLLRTSNCHHPKSHNFVKKLIHKFSSQDELSLLNIHL
jgi:hypothetical protein